MSRSSKARRGRGEGGCRWREDKGLWVAEARVGKQRITRYGHTKKEALDRLAEAKAAGPIPADVRRLTAADYLRSWVDGSRDRVTDGTWESYDGAARLHLIPRLGDVLLRLVTPAFVEGVFASMLRDGVDPGARSNAAKVLKACLRHAARIRLLPSNPAADVARPKAPPKEMRVLDRAQAGVFLAAAQVWRKHAALYVLAIASGMRLGELLALRWRDVDLAAGVVTVRRTLVRAKGGGLRAKQPKTVAALRSLGLPAFAVEALQSHQRNRPGAGPDDTVFVSRTGQFLHPANVLQSFLRLLRAAGLPRMRFHDLRHTHATLLLSAGCSLKAVSRRLGHSDPAITLRVYAHVLPADEAAIVATLSEIGGTSSVHSGGDGAQEAEKTAPERCTP